MNKIRRIVVLEHPPAEIQGLYVRLPQNVSRIINQIYVYLTFMIGCDHT